MNIKEVKKHVYFNIAIYIVIFICFIISLIAILITPVKAQEQTTDITPTIRTNFDCPWGYNSNGYCAIQTNNGGGVRAFNTRYNGVLNSISFAFPYYFNQNSNNETIDIYSTSNDFRNNNINVYCYSYESSPSQSNSRSCSLRFISQKHIQVVFPYDSLQWHEIILSSNNSITGVSNYLIQKVTLTYDDGQQDLTGIIDNATTNTTDIINNNNANSQDTQNVIIATNEKIMGQLGDICPNTLQPLNNYRTFRGVEFNPILDKNGNVSFYSVSGSLGGNYNSYVNIYKGSLASGQTLKVYWKDCGEARVQGQAYYGVNETIIGYANPTYTFTQSYENASIDLYVDQSTASTIPNTCKVYVSLSFTNMTDFCPYGSYLSKLDWINTGLSALGYTEEQIKEIQEDIKDKQEQQYNYLTDDTDPNVPTSDIEDTLDLVEINNPLGYLLTLPLTLISKINQSLTATCTDFELGHFGFSGIGWSTPLKFPCLNPQEQLGSSLWTTIDIIVAVGLLALTVYKIYQAVSNILTLGGEDEVSGSFVYWTPMEFLAIICGGTSVGVFQRRSKQ